MRPYEASLAMPAGGRSGFAAATVLTRPASPKADQYETATLEPPFRSPSRFRFRPPAPLTFGFRLLPSLPASTYLRSVLGANGNLGEHRSFRKRSERRKGRNLQKFNYPHFHSRPCSLWKVTEVVRRPFSRYGHARHHQSYLTSATDAPCSGAVPARAGAAGVCVRPLGFSTR